MAAHMPLHWEPTGKSDRQLITDARPVRYWGCPFADDVPVDQGQQLARGLVAWKRALETV